MATAEAEAEDVDGGREHGPATWGGYIGDWRRSEKRGRRMRKSDADTRVSHDDSARWTRLPCNVRKNHQGRHIALVSIVFFLGGGIS